MGTHPPGPWQRRGYPKKQHSSPRAGRAQRSPRGAGKQPAIMERPQTTWKAAPALPEGPKPFSGTTSTGPHRPGTRGTGAKAGRGRGEGGQLGTEWV